MVPARMLLAAVLAAPAPLTCQPPPALDPSATRVVERKEAPTADDDEGEREGEGEVAKTTPDPVANAMAYDEVMGALGLELGIERGLFRDGEKLSFRMTDVGGTPVQGVRLRLEKPAGDDVTTLHEATTNGAGEVLIPLSSDLVGQDARFMLVRTSAHDTLKFQWSARMTMICDERGAPEGSVSPLDLASLVYDIAPDRVYAAPGVSEKAARKMVGLLELQRAALADLTGRKPPPLAIAIVAGDAWPNRGETDPDGRIVWTIGEADVASDREAIGTIAHEWAHAIIGSRGFDERTAWLEDGLCELIAHRVSQRLRAEAGKAVVLERAWTSLQQNESAMPAVFDLTRYDKADGPSLVERITGYCDDGRRFGHAYALAWWLAVQAHDSASIRRFFTQLRAGKDILTIAKALAPTRFPLTRIDHAEVMKTLAAERDKAL